MEDLINISGAYRKERTSRVDAAIDRMDGIISFLQQDMNEGSVFEEAIEKLRAAVGETKETIQQTKNAAPPLPQPARKSAAPQPWVRSGRFYRPAFMIISER